MSEFLFHYREPLSIANAAILTLLLLLWFHVFTPTPQRLISNLPPIELTLGSPEVLPPAEPRLAPPSPKVERSAPHVVAQSVVPAKASTETLNTPVAANTQPEPVIKTIAPPAPAVASSVAAQVPLPRNHEHEAEVAYVGKVRAYLQSIKRYPTGREASLQRPAGTTVIWFAVRRSGELVDAGIEASSGVMLLDRTALATVRRGGYPAFPDEAWVGRTQQRFTVELDFLPPH